MEMQLINNRKNLISALKVVVISLPVIFLAWLISSYGVNVVFWDDLAPALALVDIQNTGKINWYDLVHLHNEHRIVFPRIIMWIVGGLTHYNAKAIIFTSASLISVAYFVFIKKTVNKKFAEFSLWDILYSIIAGFCLFNCCQYENLLWAFQVAWFLIEFCVIVGVAALTSYNETQKNKYIIFAIILAFVSSFSSLHGLAIWPCYLVIAAIYQIFNRHFDAKIWVYIIVPMICTFLMYFYGYHEVSIHAGAKAVSLLKIIEFLVRNVGSVMSGEDVLIPQLIFGSLEICLTGVLFVLLVINKKVKHNIFSLGLIIFTLGVALMLGMGRSGWNGMPSRYMTFPLLMVIANLAILKQYCSFKTWKNFLSVICFFLLAELCIYTSYEHFEDVVAWRKDKMFRAEVLLKYRQAHLYFLSMLIYPHFRTYEQAYDWIEKIEQNNLSVFYKGK